MYEKFKSPPGIDTLHNLSKNLMEKLHGDGRLPENDLFKIVIAHLPDQVYLKDTDGNFILCNMPVALNAGCASPEDMIGKTDFDFYPPDNAEKYFLDEQSVINSARALINHEENYLDKHTGEVKWNLTTKVPIKNDAGQVIGLMGINRDITQMKNALLEREKTMADLLQRNSELNQFTHIVSHNLRLPVANILGLVGLVPDVDNTDDGDLKTILQAIEESAKKLDAIIHDLNRILEVKEMAPYLSGVPRDRKQVRASR